MNRQIRHLIVGASAFALALTAHATPVLVISDGNPNDTIVVDGNSNGVASFDGSIGTWTLTVDTGISNQNAASPVLDLNFDAQGYGTLQIDFADDFVPSFGGGDFNASIGGTLVAGGSVTNSVFEGSELSGSGTYTAPFYSGDVTGVFAPAPDGGLLDEEVVITQTTSGVSSGDANLSVPDSGMTLALLGAGLLGLAAFGRFGLGRRAARG